MYFLVLSQSVIYKVGIWSLCMNIHHFYPNLSVMGW